jgi:hypothetical protein
MTPKKSTSEIPLYQGLVRELVLKIKALSSPEAQRLFDEGAFLLALADEASKLPKGCAERAIAYRELIDYQRRAMHFLGM